MRFLHTFLLYLLFLSTTHADEPKGTLMLHGGGSLTDDFVRTFFKQAGGADAKLVVIPTSLERFKESNYTENGWLKKAGFKHITVLHTRDPKVADTEGFVAPLKTATAVWLTGGRQWRSTDAYLNTRTQKELQALYHRGGVIAGSSAGATVQAEYLVRGAPEGNHIMMAKGHEEGLGLLPGAAVDQHLIRRKREQDLIPVIEKHPRLLGIGIDEGTAIVVRNGLLEVIGRSKVAIYDAKRWKDGEDRYFFLDKGTRFDLETRQKR